jgi:general transcription factor 3C polypeptide 3 (transcription factor C subunit 4)
MRHLQVLLPNRIGCKLTIFQHHFEWLKKPDETGEHPGSSHAYLFRIVADHLHEMKFYKDAFDFYRNSRDLSDQIDGSVLVQMGKCSLHVEDDQQAEECFQGAVRLDGEDIDARIELARMYERMRKPEQAFHHLNEVMLLRRRQDIRTFREPLEGIEGGNTEKTSTKESTRRRYRSRQETKKHLTQASQAEHLQSQYFILEKESEAMRSGNAASIDAWMDAARDLTDDFRGFKRFFPLDKYIKFLGYSGDSRVEAETSLDLDLTAMAERLSRGLFRLSWHL